MKVLISGAGIAGTTLAYWLCITDPNPPLWRVLQSCERADRIEQTEPCLRVSLKHDGVRDFDLVIGADGLHSRTRELVFGRHSHFKKYPGYKAIVTAIAVDSRGP